MRALLGLVGLASLASVVGCQCVARVDGSPRDHDGARGPLECVRVPEGAVAERQGFASWLGPAAPRSRAARIWSTRWSNS